MSAHRIVVALGVLLTSCATFAVTALAEPGPTRTIATTTSGGYRAVATAQRSSSGAAPTATLTVETYVRSGTTWKRAGVHRLGGIFFWKTLTAPHGLCALAIERRPASAHLVIRPLITPAIGCGRRTTFDFEARH
jgi:hypothetical protein